MPRLQLGRDQYVVVQQDGDVLVFDVSKRVGARFELGSYDPEYNVERYLRGEGEPILYNPHVVARES